MQKSCDIKLLSCNERRSSREIDVIFTILIVILFKIFHVVTRGPHFNLVYFVLKICLYVGKLVTIVAQKRVVIIT